MPTADLSPRFRELAEHLLAAAQSLEEGMPLRAADPMGSLLRAAGTYSSDDRFVSTAQRDAQDDDSNAVRADPFGAFLIDVLCDVRVWEGTADELSSLASEFGVDVEVDASLLRVRHWFSRALADVGVSVHLRDDGKIRISRHQWFTPPRAPELISIDQPRISSPLILGGYWNARGIDPARCIYCLQAPFEEIEHFVPRARGGSDDFDNLFPSCRACNRGRGDGKWARDPWEWLAECRPERLAYFRELFENSTRQSPVI